MSEHEVYCAPAQPVHWRNRLPSWYTIKAGWQALKGWRLWALLVVFFGLNAIYGHALLGGKLNFAFNIFLNVMMLCSILHACGFPRQQIAQMNEALRMVDGDIYVGDFKFPPSVNKLLLGRLDVQGPAFIHLVWHGGQQWVFPLEQLPAVRTFFRQHAPHIELVLE